MSFRGFLKQSTAVDVLLGPFLDETDGKTAETTLTITQPDIQLSKNGAAQAQKNAAQTLTHDAGGCYPANLDTTDVGTLGLLSVRVHESGALPVRQDYMVIPALVYDLFITGIPVMGGVVSYGTIAAGGGVSGGTFPAGQRANVKIGDILVVPSIGRTFITAIDNSTGVYSNVPALASDPSSTAYFVLAAPAKQALDDADFASGKSISDVLSRALAAATAARIDAAQTEATAATVSAGTHTTSLIAASTLTGLGNDQIIGRAILGKTGNIAGILARVTDYVSSTGAISLELLTGAVLPVTPATSDTFELLV